MKQVSVDTIPVVDQQSHRYSDGKEVEITGNVL